MSCTQFSFKYWRLSENEPVLLIASNLNLGMICDDILLSLLFTVQPIHQSKEIKLDWG